MVEINRIFISITDQESFFAPDLSAYKYVTDVSFLEKSKLDVENEKNTNTGKQFFEQQNNQNTDIMLAYDTKACFDIKPWFKQNKLVGFLRFDYRTETKSNDLLLLTEAIFFICFLSIWGLLFYIREVILRPFEQLSSIPYELAKGHVKQQWKEQKSKYFGKFIWGMSMLGDSLQAHKKKEMQLEREKKLLLLSISHDIKTPLSNIKLYAKAIEENIYDSEEKKKKAAVQIGIHTKAIDQFVKEIMRNATEELFSTEVLIEEFYMVDLRKKIIKSFQQKCELLLVGLEIQPVKNYMIKGDFEKAMEVIENIMENAFKYGDGKTIFFSFEEEEDCSIVKISNTGNPVSETELPHIFDSFYRGSNVNKNDGNGLGLYICREFMKKMNGDIYAVVEPFGMSFCLVFRRY